MANLRIKRLESLSLRELSLWLLNQSKDERLKEISVTEVRITNDLSYMTIYYMVYNKDKLNALTELLEHYKVFIRQMLAGKINARKMPELIFKYDESLAYGNHIDELINDLHK